MKKKRRLLPLGIKNRVRTELPALVALEAIGQPWFCDDHLADMMACAMVCQLVAGEGSEIRATADELFALLGAETLDAAAIGPRVVAVNAWLQRQENGRLQSAIDRLLLSSPAARSA